MFRCPIQSPARREHLQRIASSLVGVALLNSYCATVQAQSLRKERLAVLYPEIGEPFRAVFQRILDGIDDKLQISTHKIAVQSNSDVNLMASELHRSDLKVVIALGRAGMRLATLLDQGVDVLAGGVVSPAGNEARELSMLCLAPDPLLLMQRLKTLQPGVKRVHVAYSGRYSAWLMRFAQDAAKQLGLELHGQEVNDLRAALRYYQDFFAQASTGDSLWLPQDPLTVDEASVLPLVLQESWNHNLTLFSSNIAHVRRGALFSLFPNNFEFGRSLGRMVLSRLNQNQPFVRGAIPLRDVVAALNTRTASHLGLDLSPQLQSSFELLLPER